MYTVYTYTCMYVCMYRRACRSRPADLRCKYLALRQLFYNVTRNESTLWTLCDVEFCRETC